ncbi:MAG: hypothetical protein WDN06_01130 [Asticcacaulis sp.]
MNTYTEPYYNPPSPVGGYVRAFIFTLILAIVGVIAFTVFQGSPQAHATPLPVSDSGSYADTAGEPAAIDAQPINN